MRLMSSFSPLAAALVAALTTALIPTPGAAVGTSPTLALTSVQAFASTDGKVTISAAGAFGLDDLVQFTFPVGIIISRGSSFVRYDFAGQLREGSDAVVANGVDAADIPHLLTVGTSAVAPARLVELRPDRVSVALPADFGSGPADVVVYSVWESAGYVSNSLTVTIP